MCRNIELKYWSWKITIFDYPNNPKIKCCSYPQDCQFVSKWERIRFFDWTTPGTLFYPRVTCLIHRFTIDLLKERYKLYCDGDIDDYIQCIPVNENKNMKKIFFLQFNNDRILWTVNCVRSTFNNLIDQFNMDMAYKAISRNYVVSLLELYPKSLRKSKLRVKKQIMTEIGPSLSSFRQLSSYFYYYLKKYLFKMRMLIAKIPFVNREFDIDATRKAIRKLQIRMQNENRTQKNGSTLTFCINELDYILNAAILLNGKEKQRFYCELMTDPLLYSLQYCNQFTDLKFMIGIDNQNQQASIGEYFKELLCATFPNGFKSSYTGLEYDFSESKFFPVLEYTHRIRLVTKHMNQYNPEKTPITNCIQYIFNCCAYKDHPIEMDNYIKTDPVILIKWICDKYLSDLNTVQQIVDLCKNWLMSTANTNTKHGYSITRSHIENVQRNPTLSFIKKFINWMIDNIPIIIIERIFLIFIGFNVHDVINDLYHCKFIFIRNGQQFVRELTSFSCPRQIYNDFINLANMDCLCESAYLPERGYQSAQQLSGKLVCFYEIFDRKHIFRSHLDDDKKKVEYVIDLSIKKWITCHDTSVDSTVLRCLYYLKYCSRLKQMVSNKNEKSHADLIKWCKTTNILGVQNWSLLILMFQFMYNVKSTAWLLKHPDKLTNEILDYIVQIDALLEDIMAFESEFLVCFKNGFQNITVPSFDFKTFDHLTVQNGKWTNATTNQLKHWLNNNISTDTHIVTLSLAHECCNFFKQRFNISQIVGEMMRMYFYIIICSSKLCNKNI